MIEDKIGKYLLGESKKPMNETVLLKQMGPNFTRVHVGNKTLYFSYETLVAIETDSGTFGTDQKFSKTTSKHMNQINIDKKIPQKELERMAG